MNDEDKNTLEIVPQIAKIFYDNKISMEDGIHIMIKLITLASIVNGFSFEDYTNFIIESLKISKKIFEDEKK